MILHYDEIGNSRTMNDPAEAKVKLESNNTEMKSPPEKQMSQMSPPLEKTKPNAHNAMPQRSPFAIQELLGLSDSNSVNHRPHAAATNSYGSQHRPISSSFSAERFNHHQMSMAAVNASRMAYFNAQAAVAAAFLPHNMNSIAAAAGMTSGGAGSPLATLANHRNEHPSSGRTIHSHHSWIFQININVVSAHRHQFVYDVNMFNENKIDLFIWSSRFEDLLIMNE